MRENSGKGMLRSHLGPLHGGDERETLVLEVGGKELHKARCDNEPENSELPLPLKRPANPWIKLLTFME